MLPPLDGRNAIAIVMHKSVRGAMLPPPAFNDVERAVDASIRDARQRAEKYATTACFQRNEMRVSLLVEWRAGSNATTD